MIELGRYSVIEHLRDGREIAIRTLRSDDRDDMLAAVGRTGAQSLQRRFFGVKRGFSEQEIAFFTNIDFANHVALVALAEEEGRPTIVAGGRYVLVNPLEAEVAFLVIDAYQRQGIGALLIKHLIEIARSAGLQKIVAEVLAENAAMLKLFKRFDFKAGGRTSPGVVHLAKELG